MIRNKEQTITINVQHLPGFRVPCEQTVNTQRKYNKH